MFPDRKQAIEHAKALTGSPTSILTFQLLCDRKTRRPPPSFAGTVSGVWDRLAAANRDDWGVFVTVQATVPGRRRAADVVGLRALYADDDQDRISLEQLPVPPSIVIRTKRGRHFYFLLIPGEPISEFSRNQTRLVLGVGADPNCKDIARVLRLAGFAHRKGSPFMVSIEVAEPSRLYNMAEVVASLPEVQEEQAVVTPVVLETPVRQDVAYKAAVAYVAAVPGAVEGEGGDLTTWKLACALVRGFDLDDEQALSILAVWNEKCDPAWSEEELEEKISSARRFGSEPIGERIPESMMIIGRPGWGRPRY